jgi:hypothetical protein
LTYSAESEISKFSGNNKFVISYRRNFLEVLPADLDDPDAKLPFQPGMEKTRTVLKCSVKSNNLIRCTDAKGKQRSYTRQP